MVERGHRDLGRADGAGARRSTGPTWSSVTLTGLEPVLGALGGRARRRPATRPRCRRRRPAAAAMFSPDMLFAMMMPMLLGGWAGSMIGLLSHRALGQFDLPLPLDGAPTLLFVAHNVDAFAEEWSLPVDELRYALALREVVHGAQRAVPWVRERLVRLRVGVRRRVRGAARRDGEPTRRLRSVRSVVDGGARRASRIPTCCSARCAPSARSRCSPSCNGSCRCSRATPTSSSSRLGERMVPAHGRLDEALRRHRLERGDATGFVDRLLGLELDRGHYDTGVAFCRGVDGTQRRHARSAQPALDGRVDGADRSRARRARASGSRASIFPTPTSRPADDRRRREDRCSRRGRDGRRHRAGVRARGRRRRVLRHRAGRARRRARARDDRSLRSRRRGRRAAR